MMRYCLLAIGLLTCLFGQSQSYFQQEVRYQIEVSLNDKSHMLFGSEQFEYINNSPDTLHEILVHLWPNAYKNAKTAMAKQKFRDGDYFMLWANQKDRGYIDSLDFKINNQKADWEYFENYEDIAILYLEEGLLPGNSLTVSTPFRVKLPSGSISRLGHIGESYQITQWYVKPAVYDKDGWHEMPYLTQGEFYSEYGSYDVKITLPENYIVGATGDLQTESEVKWLNELAEKPIPLSTDKTQKSMRERNDEFPASSAKTKTLHFKQNNVHDFGWFADKRWIVRKGEIELPHSKRTVTTWAMFTPQNAEIWDKASIKAINDGVYYYSLWTGDYPYNQCTAVDGTISAGGGMEYPNVTVIGSSDTEQMLATVIIHEVGHNWFYGILGSNERDNAWMDEGINSFFETRTMLATNDTLEGLGSLSIGGLDAGKALGLDNFSYQYMSEELLYLLSARGNKDQPIQMPSDYFSSMNYGTIVYKKTAIAFNYLMNYLGEESFNKCMAAYFEKWKFKHPQPEDIEQVFEEVSGKNLDWFFDTLINTKGKLDVKATSIHKKDGKYELTVYNKGDFASPFSVDVIRNGKTVSRTWYDAGNSASSSLQVPGEWAQYKVDAQKGDIIKLNNIEGIPEYDKNNNTIRTRGVFRRAEPYTFKFLTGVDDPEHSQVFWAPMVGWNNYNKWMAGVTLHNQVVPARNFIWNFSPMYSIATNSVVGFGKMETYNGRMGFGIRGQRFAYETTGADDLLTVYTYRLLSPYLRIKLFPNRFKKDWSGELRAEWLMIGGRVKGGQNSTFGEYNSFESDPKVKYGKDGDIHHLRVTANIRKKMLRSELRIQSAVEGGEYTDFGIMHQHILNFDYIYRGKGKKKIRNRLYFGQSNGFTMYASGQRTGIAHSVTSSSAYIPKDYAYDALFLGRSDGDGLLSQQIHRTQGGMAAPTAMGANLLLMTYNAEFDLPVKFPIGIYGGYALMNNKVPGYANDSKWTNAWNAGVSLPLIRNVFQIYVPAIYSNNIADEVKLNDLKFGETILFELNLKLCNPLEMARNFDL